MVFDVECDSNVGLNRSRQDTMQIPDSLKISQGAVFFSKVRICFGSPTC